MDEMSEADLVKRFQIASREIRRLYRHHNDMLGDASTYLAYSQHTKDMFEIERQLRSRFNDTAFVNALRLEHEVLVARTLLRRSEDSTQQQLHGAIRMTRTLLGVVTQTHVSRPRLDRG